MSYVTRIWSGLVGLATGMALTFRQMFRKPVTELYPHEEPRMSSAYRSVIQLKEQEETGSHACIACLQCSQNCPSYCIELEGEKVSGTKKKRPAVFNVDFAKCSLCGICITVCPTRALEHSAHYDVAGYRPDAFIYDLLEDFRDTEEAWRDAEREKAAQKAEAAAKKAAAEAEEEQT